MAMTIEAKDLKLLKNEYTLKIREVSNRIGRVEKRVDWVEKLLWLSAGAVISWLATGLIRSL
jgi:hypothetical protein